MPHTVGKMARIHVVFRNTIETNLRFQFSIACVVQIAWTTIRRWTRTCREEIPRTNRRRGPMTPDHRGSFNRMTTSERSATRSTCSPLCMGATEDSNIGQAEKVCRIHARPSAEQYLHNGCAASRELLLPMKQGSHATSIRHAHLYKCRNAGNYR